MKLRKKVLLASAMLATGALTVGCGQADDASFATAVGAVSDKVEVCHYTGNGDVHIISVNQHAVDAHLAHGDRLPGDSDDYGGSGGCPTDSRP